VVTDAAPVYPRVLDEVVRRGHYEIATETPHQLRVAAAFTQLARAI
jgi:hypothetical protein